MVFVSPGAKQGFKLSAELWWRDETARYSVSF
jgi:hypothetical protein